MHGKANKMVANTIMQNTQTVTMATQYLVFSSQMMAPHHSKTMVERSSNVGPFLLVSQHFQYLDGHFIF